MWTFTLSQPLLSLGCTQTSALTVMYLLQCKSRVRAKFDSQSAVPGSNPKSQRKHQLKRRIFAQFLAKTTCFLKEGGGFPQISTQILSKVCKSLPNPSQTWAQIQKYSKNRFFFLFFFPPALLLLVLARIKKSREARGKRMMQKFSNVKHVLSELWAKIWDGCSCTQHYLFLLSLYPFRLYYPVLTAHL